MGNIGRVKLNLAVGPKIALGKILAVLNLDVWYGIAIRTCIYESKIFWLILSWQWLSAKLPNFNSPHISGYEFCVLHARVCTKFCLIVVIFLALIEYGSYSIVILFAHRPRCVPLVSVVVEMRSSKQPFHCLSKGSRTI